MFKKVSVIQENGQVTLPAEFRKQYGLKRGDIVVFRQTEEGLLINPTQTLAVKLLDEIGEALKEQGVSLEDLIESSHSARKTYRKNGLSRSAGLNAE